MAGRVYLDNAATTWPKPEGVYQAVDGYLRNQGAAAGRSAYGSATEIQRAINQTRARLAEFLGVDRAERVVFTANGTDSLNLAIHGLLEPGDHVVTTVVEHNSVLRPLCDWRARQATVTYVDVDSTGHVNPDDIRQALTPKTRLVAVIAASNVTGTLQPVTEIGHALGNHPALFLVDAAQTVGHLPVSVKEIGCDLLAAPGHKGLLGILGTGILGLSDRAANTIRSFRQGGTGTRSDDQRQPGELPDRLEAGNLNVPGVLSLAAGLDYLIDRGWEAIRSHETELVKTLREGLQAIAGVRVFGPDDPRQSVGVVSIQIEGYDPQEAAALLDQAYQVQVRAGLHCAPQMHAALGTASTGGTVRFSVGPFTTSEEIKTAIVATEEIARAALEI